MSDVDKTVSVTHDGTNSYSGSVSIPSTITYGGVTYAVTSIGSDAFRLSSNLTNVTIPNSITTIGSYVFTACTKLNNITLPNSIESIGSGAFLNTGWLNNQPDGILYLNDCCIGYKGLVKDPEFIIRIKEGTRVIVATAFQDFTYTTINKIIIPNSVLYINLAAFENCKNIYEFQIGSNVLEIGADAFRTCVGIEDIVIPDKVKTLGYGVFYG